ncbi:MAG: hypothetical protein LIV24_01190 [Eubacterium sp.]|nr:hypothetical protein [Eubacterium sp.]
MKTGARKIWDIWKKTPATFSSVIFFIILSIPAKSPLVMVFALVFLPGTLLIDLLIEIVRTGKEYKKFITKIGKHWND